MQVNVKTPTSEQDSVSDFNSDSMPARLYAKEKGAPFTALHFGLKAMYTTPVVKNMIDTIESYLIDVSPSGTVDEYRFMLRDISDEVRIEAGKHNLENLERLYNYVKLLNKQNKLSKQIDKIRSEYRIQ